MAPMPEIDLLLADLESSRIERTQSIKDTDKFCEAICAFANDIGNSGLPGYLFIGIDKSGEPTGTPISENFLTELDQIRKNG